MEKYTVKQLESRDFVKNLVLKEHIKKMYDSNDNVLFGSRYIKGLITYEYIPAEYMETDRPFIIGSSCSYDGKGNAQLPAGSEFIAFADLKTKFPDNTYAQ